MIGVGLIGTGFMGKCHAMAWSAVGPAFGETPGVRLVHLGEAGRDLAERRARELGFDRASGDWRAVVADPDVDVVSLTTPNAFHAEMAIAALEAGKHLWCEKPMAPAFPEAEAMTAAARKSDRVAILGYNYIQSPAIRHIRKLLAEGVIGAPNHLRIEMDEDFMADAATPFNWKHEAASGYGALDDFAVHPLSLIRVLLGDVCCVMADLAKPYRDRPAKDGGRRVVENYDTANVLLHLPGNISGVLIASRAAWGRKGRIALQIYGSKGSILYDQERMNEFQLYTTEGRATERGYATILTAPHHAPYDRFIPAPGHGLGFNDLKIIECRELMAAIDGKPSHVIDFETGLTIERTVHAMARSYREGRWIEVGA